MVMSLFSVFDPVVKGFQLNWVILVIYFYSLVLMYYYEGSVIQKFKIVLLFNLNKSFKDVCFPFYLGMSLLGVSVGFFLAGNNFFGLFPFVFTSTAHIYFTLGLGLVGWMSFFLMGWVSNFKCSLAHLVPEGSPIVLAPLLVLIESVSHLIRPFTLSVRLAANMMAGHLIMGLLSQISLLSMYGFWISVVLQMLLLLLEFMVVFIQGFDFSILLVLYAIEYY